MKRHHKRKRNYIGDQVLALEKISEDFSVFLSVQGAIKREKRSLTMSKSVSALLVCFDKVIDDIRKVQ